MRKSSVDLTTGNPVRLILMFAVPILIGQLFQNLYNSVDSAVVGTFVGREALAAVTASSDISMLIVGFFTGLSTGSGVLFSRYFGAKRYDRLHDCIHTALLFSFILGLVMALVGVVLTPVLLRLVRCPEDVFPHAVSYLRIYFIGIFFTAVYNIGAGVLRAVGDSRSPLYYLIAASLTNIALDLVFVAVLGMAVEGVAIATILSQALSVALVFGRMLRSDDVYRLVPRDLRIYPGYLGEIVSLGLPSAIQSGLLSFSNLFVQRYINAFGSAAMAGMGAAKKIDKFVGIVAQSLGLAVTTYVSQNYGAGEVRRAREGTRTCLLLSLGIMILPGILIFTCAPGVMRIFTKDAEAVGYGVAMIRTMLPFFFFMCCNQIISGTVRGYGHAGAVMVLSLIGMIGLRQLWLALSMRWFYSVRNIYVSFPIGWAFSALFVFLYYVLKIRPGILKKEREG